MEKRKTKHGALLTTIFSIISVVYMFPILLVLMNSFKKKAYISRKPFAIPSGKMYVGLDNYFRGVKQANFFEGAKWSLVITVGSVFLILLCTSMCAWYIVRVKSIVTSAIYYLCLFAMIVPFQMEMFTLSKLANTLKLNSLGTLDHLSWLWRRSCGLHVYRLCQIHSAGDRGSGYDRWLQPAADLLWRGTSDHETDLRDRSDPSDHVDLE